MNDIVNLIVSNGMAVVIVGYFIFKDYKQTGQMVETLNELKEVMTVIKETIKHD